VPAPQQCNGGLAAWIQLLRRDVRERTPRIAATIDEPFPTGRSGGAQLLERFAQQLAIATARVRLRQASNLSEALFDFFCRTIWQAPPGKEYEVIDQRRAEDHGSYQVAFQA
jgi:hypothetical protein